MATPLKPKGTVIDAALRDAFLNQKMPAVRPLPFGVAGKNYAKRLLTLVTFKRQWELVEDYVMYIPWLNITLFVPKGFVFDFASIPKPFWSVMSPVGTLMWGSVPHDFGYKYGGLLHQIDIDDAYIITQFITCSKSDLDTLLADITKCACGLKGPGFIARTILWLGGLPTWWAARKANLQVTTDYPEFNIEAQ